jgi:ketosteroid isomerase-like protein
MGFLKRLRKPRSGGPHIETVRAVAAAADARDADEYVKHMTEDVVVNPPGFLMGRHELHGKEQVRAAFAKFAEMLEPGRKLYVSKRRYVVDRADEAKILVLDELTVTPEKGDPLGTNTFAAEAALLFTMTAESKVARLDSWPSEAEGLAQLQDPVEVGD